MYFGDQRRFLKDKVIDYRRTLTFIILSGIKSPINYNFLEELKKENSSRLNLGDAYNIYKQSNNVFILYFKVLFTNTNITQVF